MSGKGGKITSYPVIDRDFLSTFIELALGTPPDSAVNGIPNPVALISQVGGTDYLTLEFTVAPGERDAEITVEVTGDLSTWTATPHLVTTTDNPNGSTTYRYRDSQPFALHPSPLSRGHATKSNGRET